MQLRCEFDAVRACRFLITCGYPHAWPVEQLQQCLLVRLERAERTVGYLWFHGILDADGAIELHACLDPRHHGRWLTRGTLRDLFKLAEFIGAKTLIARPETIPQGFVLLKVGFEQVGPIYLYNMKEPNKWAA